MDRGGLAENRNPPLALEIVRVHHPLHGFAALIAESTGLTEHGVDEGRLPVVDVGDDGDVAVAVVAMGLSEGRRGRCPGTRIGAARVRAHPRRVKQCSPRGAPVALSRTTDFFSRGTVGPSSETSPVPLWCTLTSRLEFAVKMSRFYLGLTAGLMALAVLVNPGSSAAAEDKAATEAPKVTPAKKSPLRVTPRRHSAEPPWTRLRR